MYFPTIYSTLLTAVATGVLATPVTRSTPPTSSLTLQQQLELAGTAVDRLALLTNDQDFVFDFNTSTTGITAGLGMQHLLSLSRFHTTSSESNSYH